VYRRKCIHRGGRQRDGVSSSEAIVSAGDIGDINAGVYYQLWRETEQTADVVGSMRVRSPREESLWHQIHQPDPNNSNLSVPDTLPTGSGVWTTQLGLSLLKTSDPLVLFATVATTTTSIVISRTSRRPRTCSTRQSEPGQFLAIGGGLCRRNSTSAHSVSFFAVSSDRKWQQG
jgi:hypothetical protein